MQLVDLILALLLLVWGGWGFLMIQRGQWWHVPTRAAATIPFWVSLVLFVLFVPFQYGLAKLAEKYADFGRMTIPVVILVSALTYIFISITPPFISLWKRKGAYSFWKSIKAGFIALMVVTPLVFLVEATLILFLEKVLGITRIDQDAILFLLAFSDSPLQFAFVALLIATCIPLLEELLFRGFLQNALRKILPTKMALFLTALIFTFFHFSPDQGSSNWIILPALMILALTLSWVYDRTGNLFSSIALHSFFNIINIFTLLLAHD